MNTVDADDPASPGLTLSTSDAQSAGMPGMPSGSTALAPSLSSASFRPMNTCVVSVPGVGGANMSVDIGRTKADEKGDDNRAYTRANYGAVQRTAASGQLPRADSSSEGTAAWAQMARWGTEDAENTINFEIKTSTPFLRSRLGFR